MSAKNRYSVTTRRYSLRKPCLRFNSHQPDHETAAVHSVFCWRSSSVALEVYNPSTMRVLGVRVGEVSETQATVFTEEYWYLRWWPETEARYAYVYNETNHQRYILTRIDGRWLVDTNVYPPPRATTAARLPKGREARR